MLTSSWYNIKKSRIAVASRILHNFIRKWNWNDSFLEEYMEGDLDNVNNTNSKDELD